MIRKMKTSIWRAAYLLILLGMLSSLECVAQEQHKSAKEIAKLGRYKFTDTLGKKVRLSDFKGKWVFVDMWYSGCGGCITANQGISIVHESFKNDNIVFLSISVDQSREKWMLSVTPGAKKSKLNPWAGMYVPAKGTIVLYTSGSGQEIEFRKHYVPLGRYPQLLLFDNKGVLVNEKPPRPDVEPDKLVRFIKQKMAE